MAKAPYPFLPFSSQNQSIGFDFGKEEGGSRTKFSQSFVKTECRELLLTQVRVLNCEPCSQLNIIKGEIDMTDRELLSKAKAASMNAYVPYSRFAVGAALECTDGTVFTGCNVENAALGSTICAERTACCKAVSEGHREFRRIAIYADSENWCTPCGACRQFLAEFSPEMEVLCAKAGDRYVSYKLSDLLPHTFNY